MKKRKLFLFLFSLVFLFSSSYSLLAEDLTLVDKKLLKSTNEKLISIGLKAELLEKNYESIQDEYEDYQIQAEQRQKQLAISQEKQAIAFKKLSRQATARTVGLSIGVVILSGVVIALVTCYETSLCDNVIK